MKSAARLLILCLTVLLPAVTGHATDLNLKSINLDWGQPRRSQATQFTVSISNDNILLADSYTINLQAMKAGGGIEYNQTFDGPPIAPFVSSTFTFPIQWIPADQGNYTITGRIDFADEINPTNNSKTITTTVLPQLFLATLIHQQIHAPFVSNAKNNAVLEYRYGPFENWRYLNVRSMYSLDSGSWILRNKPVPPSVDSITMAQQLYLETNNPAINQDTSRLVFSLTTDTLTTDTTLKQYTDLEWTVRSKWYGGLTDTTTSLGLSLSSVNYSYSSGTPTVGHTIGCNMPNIDLDNSVYGPRSIADYAGDLNACAPTAFANSMQWLDETWSDIDPGGTHRAKLIEISRMMLRPDSTGVWSEDFLAAKLEYINKYDLPVIVKFQRRGSTEDVESQDDYLSIADNQGDGGYPKFDWIRKEVQDSEDVELFLEYHADAGSGSTVTGRHVVVLTGAHSTTSSNELWYKDDNDQRNAGGTQERSVTWQTFPAGTPYFDPWKDSDGTAHITVPYAAFSESRDTSVHRKGRGRLDRLGRWLYGVVVGKRSRTTSGETIDASASTSLHFANLITPAIAFTPIATTPVGDQLGERVTSVYHSDQLSLADTSTYTDAAIWYADTLLTDTTLSKVYLAPYQIQQHSDSSRSAAISTGDEVYTSPNTRIFLDSAWGGSFVPVDTVLRWYKHIPMDVDSSSTTSLYPSPLSDRGSQGEAAIGTIIKVLSSDSTYPFVMTDAQLRVQLSALTGRTTVGTRRDSLIGGTLEFIDQRNLPLRFDFQSSNIVEPLYNPRNTVHGANNKTGTGGFPDLDFLKGSLLRAPIVLEIGEYSPTSRLGGFYAYCSGYLDYNNRIQVVLDRDFKEGMQGGLTRTVQNIAQEGNTLVIPELAAPNNRAIIEGIYALFFDPTISNVGEDLGREISFVHVAPNPATDAIIVHAHVVRSDRAFVHIVDMQGQEVASLAVTAHQLLEGLRIPLDHVGAGTFSVRITTPHAMHSATFVLVR